MATAQKAKNSAIGKASLTACTGVAAVGVVLMGLSAINKKGPAFADPFVP
jgi:hypothetical protein